MDLDTYINVYKTGLPTDARDNAIQMLQGMKLEKMAMQAQMPQEGTSSPQSSATAMNMLAGQQSLPPLQ